MRSRFEFALHSIAAAHMADGVDTTLALMGSLGWEMRALAATPEGGLIVGLQRPLDEELPLPDAPTLAATLEEPLAALSAADLGPR